MRDLQPNQLAAVQLMLQPQFLPSYKPPEVEKRKRDEDPVNAIQESEYRYACHAMFNFTSLKREPWDEEKIAGFEKRRLHNATVVWPATWKP